MLKCFLGALLILFYFVPSLSAQQLMQDVVYLKDGSVIRGQIIEQIPNVSIKIQTKDGNIFVCKMEEVDKIVKEPLKVLEIKEEKSPILAFLLSSIVPGLGQYYNGEVEKGIIQEALVVGGAVLALTAGVEDWGDYYEPAELTYWFWIGLGTAAGASIWSVIDAPLSASRINRERSQEKWGHLIEFNNEKYALGLDVAPMKQGMGMKLTLHF
jgi:hypothetical protein